VTKYSENVFHVLLKVAFDGSWKFLQRAVKFMLFFPFYVVSFFVVVFSNVTQMLNKDCLYESTFKIQWPEEGEDT